MDTKVDNVLNYIHRELPVEKQRRALLNRLACEFGIRLHARAMDAYARPAERYTTDDDDGDYKTCVEALEQAERESYKHKIELVKQIINKAGKEAELFDFMARPKELHKLLDVLTYSQIGRLNFFGLGRMLRVATQARDSTNPTAYILSSYKNLIESKDYRAKWVKQREAEQAQERAESLAEFERQYREDRELAGEEEL